MPVTLYYIIQKVSSRRSKATPVAQAVISYLRSILALSLELQISESVEVARVHFAFCVFNFRVVVQSEFNWQELHERHDDNRLEKFFRRSIGSKRLVF